MVDTPQTPPSPAPHPARVLWQRLETLHAVTYFAPESRAAAAEVGFKGFWMGYFGFRAAPMGAVGAGVVAATFANFAPAMVERAVPSAWDFATPADAVVARSAAAAAALRAIVPDIDDVAPTVVDRLAPVVASLDLLGRPLAAANAGVDLPDDPVEQLWQTCTTLREHRGDGHLMALAAADLSGLDAHVLFAAERGVPVELLRDNRGWTEADWETSVDGLAGRGLIDADELSADGRALSDGGAALRGDVEAMTDELAGRAIAAVLGGPGDADFDAVLALVDGPARTVAGSGVLPFPNPMGLSPISGSD